MALSANTKLALELGDFNTYPVQASTTIYEGAALSIDASTGGARNLTLGDRFAGHAAAYVDNSAGLIGAKNVTVRGTEPYRAQVAVTGASITSTGAKVYATDNGTYTLTAGTNTPVGVVTRHVSSTTVIVEFRPFAYDAVSQG